MLRVPTDAGTLYFKANSDRLAYELAVTEVLARRRPDLLPELVATDEARGWMLMWDAGVQLSAVLERDPDLRYWEKALPEYAQLQIDVTADADELARLFPLDRRLAAMPAHYAALAKAAGVLRVGDAEGLTEDEYRRVRELGPAVQDWFDELVATPIQETIQNDDFTHGSIFLAGGGHRFLDWGDACVSHPFFTLTVTLRVVEWVHGLPPSSSETERVRDAYLEPWTAFESHETLVRLATTARRLGQLCRAALYLWESSAPDGPAWSARLLIDPEAWRAAA